MACVPSFASFALMSYLAGGARTSIAPLLALTPWTGTCSFHFADSRPMLAPLAMGRRQNHQPPCRRCVDSPVSCWTQAESRSHGGQGGAQGRDSPPAEGSRGSAIGGHPGESRAQEAFPSQRRAFVWRLVWWAGGSCCCSTVKCMGLSCT